MKKQIIAAIGAITLLTALTATSAFAADIKQDTADKTAQMTVTQSVDEDYTITIPAGMAADDTEAAITLDATLLLDGQSFIITVDSANGFKLELPGTEKDALGYTINTVAATDGEIGTLNAEETEIPLVVAVSDEPTLAGDHTDTITFTIAPQKS